MGSYRGKRAAEDVQLSHACVRIICGSLLENQFNLKSDFK